MEKEKPYSCEVCKKRYKNLNGLKYVRYPLPNNNSLPLDPFISTRRIAVLTDDFQHKNHSFYCNPELSSQIIAAHLQQQLPDFANQMQSPSPAPPRQG